MRPPTEAALLWRRQTFVFVYEFGEKIRERLLSRELSSRVRLEATRDHLHAQRLALAAYLPTPPFGTLTRSGGDDVVVVRVDRHTATPNQNCRTPASTFNNPSKGGTLQVALQLIGQPRHFLSRLFVASLDCQTP